MGKPLIIAHRGASGDYPENTLSAFRAAADAGADMCELDVRLSRDGVLAVIHDETIDRTTDHIGVVAGMTMAELRLADAGIKSGAGFAGERIPALDDVFDALADRCGVNIELKSGELEPRVCELIRRRAASGSAMVSSFDMAALKNIREIDPAIRVGVLGDKHPGQMIAAARAIGAWSINPRFDLVTPEIAAAAHGFGLKVLVWTVDAPELMRLMTEYGIDGIMTNYPGNLRRILDA
ncbi:MAG: glycerophosphodiester phosphodiesterase [Candidatus Binataceae bacterium]